MADLSNVRHLLIDLGGVLYEIDFPATLEKFRSLQPADVPPMALEKEAQFNWFADHDAGKIDIDAFAQGLMHTYHLQASRKQVKQIWLDL